MSLYQVFETELKQAMLDRNKDRVLVLRNIKSALKYKSIELKRDLDDTDILQVINTLAKQRRESIDAFQQASRLDLVKKEELELKILEEFMPPQLSEDALKKIIRETIQEVAATGPGDLGKVMKVLMPKVRGQADGKVVNILLKDLLK